MRVLMSGDIVGKPGRLAFARTAALMRQRGEIDFVIANAENAAGGRGLTPKLAEELFDAGADVLTMGDHVWDQKELAPYLRHEPRILRPANLPPGCPGQGWITVETDCGTVTVINLIGRVFLQPADCPFRAADEILNKKTSPGHIRIVDLHAEATSEKIAMGRYLDGRTSAVVGTHTHVQTSDEKVLPKGTGYITDLGMTGPHDSSLGRDLDAVLHKFLTGMPSRWNIATGDVAFEGILLDADPATGKARSIKRIRELIAPMA